MDRSQIEAHKRELEHTRGVLGQNHPRVAELLSMIGLYHQHMEHNLEAALTHFEQALAVLYTQPEGICEVEIAVALTDIGNVYRSMNVNDEAVAKYRQALAIFEEKGTSANHPSIGAIHRGLDLLKALPSRKTESHHDGSET
uniref:Kinesin light chain n=1 Tax=Pseudictyota dubia TaxID=2749911 RepID=A0A7R9WJE2_9STRA|mmetsp:Transcript_7687/g.13890  ORF Transcript_7687/g.13890 Transcript_7687/m.13890 type:complete len:142 (+) Transcript_7687:147-572(+)